jgi:pentatricopeptide repeat protein
MEEALLGERETALNQLEAYRRETQSPSVSRRTTDFQMGAVGCYVKLGKFDEALEILRDMDANGYKTYWGAGELDIGQLKSLVGGDPRFKEIFDRWDAWAKAQPDPVDP